MDEEREVGRLRCTKFFRLKKTVVVTLIVVFVLGLAGLAINRKTALLYWRIVQIKCILESGESGWADDAIALLRRTRVELNDDELLATTLVNSHDASLVAEGLRIFEENVHPDIRRQLGRFKDDSRWTWHLVELRTIVAEIETRIDERNKLSN